MKTASYSFLAAFVGWLVSSAIYLPQLGVGAEPLSLRGDLESLLFWSLFFTLLGWAAVGLPLALKLNEIRHRRFFFVVAAATLSTTFTFGLIAALTGFVLIFLVWWPVLIGIIGGMSFWLLEQKRRVPAWVCWALPITFFPFMKFVVLPIGVAHFPYTTHVFAGGIAGKEALFNVIEMVKVGDRAEDLHHRYPEIFQYPKGGGQFASVDGWFYSVSFDDEGHRVTEVVINKRP
jgi:hypothetical protein